MTDDQKFMIYVIAWGLLAAIFIVLRKKEKSIKKKKTITLIGGLLILFLILGFALWIGLPWKPLSFFALLAVGMIYIGQKNTYYCESCGHAQQQLFSKGAFCSKCGKKYNLRVDGDAL